MIYFYRRARQTRSCETRLEANGPGFELIVIEGRESRVEHFDDVDALAARQRELRYEWMSSGWRDIEGDFDEDE
jgi:hypothetical protein